MPGLDGQAAGVEGQPFADQSQRPPRTPLRGVGEFHEPGRLGGAPVHAKQATQAGPPDGRLVQDLDGQAPVASHAPDPVSEFGRRQAPARLVDQVAGQGHAVHHGGRPLNGRPHPGSRAPHQRHPRQVVVVLSGLVAEPVDGQG